MLGSAADHVSVCTNFILLLTIACRYFILYLAIVSCDLKSVCILDYVYSLTTLCHVFSSLYLYYFADTMVCTGCCATLDHIVTYLFKQLTQKGIKNCYKLLLVLHTNNRYNREKLDNNRKKGRND